MKCIVTIDYLDYFMDVNAESVLSLLSMRRVAEESGGVYKLSPPGKVSFRAVSDIPPDENPQEKTPDLIPPFTILEPAPPAKPSE